ncbi:rho GTPase-activating protein 26-like isoform X24 [Apostichopus japonicus]|uniref:rho GTPase-activating protein 26-like isoform X24 n=1 Tax=Stichopus japonicus TaxID=307972 RepID=UPI003AB15969
MVLQPLEFTECFLDSPEFRDNLHSHEAELERTNKAIKELIRSGKALVEAAKNLSKAQRAFSETLVNFNFECIGTTQTDDETVISKSLKEFGKLISLIEDERDRMLDLAKEQLIVRLDEFRKEQIGSAKDHKKTFDKQTEKFCKSLDTHVNLSTKKRDTSLQEADAGLEMERRQFHRDSLTYVFKLQEVQEKKKFEFVETLLGFMYSWLTFYHQGHEVSVEFKPYMTDLQLKLQTIRAGFENTRAEGEMLMHKMLEKPYENKKQKDVQEGYLYVQEKRALGSAWTKCYCQYTKDTKTLRMSAYVQTLPKSTGDEHLTVTSCTRRVADTDKRFCFDITVMEKPNVITLQAITDDERTQWMLSMGGKEPVYLNPAQIKKTDDNLLNDIGFHFIQKCIEAIESRGLDDQGLYRVVGVNSKVQRLTSVCLDKRKPHNVNLSDSGEWEIKTITSALKNYFRNLPEPLMTFDLHDSFIAAAKHDSKTLRINDIHALVHQIPEPNFEMLDMLISHLKKVSENCNRNLMTKANLGVCFGPTLIRPEEETMQAILDIKFSNIVVEILIANYDTIFKTCPRDPPPDMIPRRSVVPSNSASSTTSSASSVSSSKASPRHHQKTPAPQPPFSDSTHPSLTQPSKVKPPPPTKGESRDHSPRRAGEDLPDLTGRVRTLSQHYLDLAISQDHQTPPSINRTSNQVMRRNAKSLKSGRRRPMSQFFLPSSKSKDSKKENIDLHFPKDFPNLEGVSVARLSRSFHINTNNCHEQPKVSLKQKGRSLMQKSARELQSLKLKFQGVDSSPEAKTIPAEAAPAEPQYSSSDSRESISSATSNSTHSSSSSPPSSKKANSLSTVFWRSIQMRKYPKYHTYHGKTPPHSLDEDLENPLQSYRPPAELARKQSGTTTFARPPLARTDELDNNHEAPEVTPRDKSPSISSSTSTVSQLSNSSADTNVAQSDIAKLLEGGNKRGICVRTLYACDADNESELSFQPNQIIVNVRESKERGWVLGTLNGKTGLIPSNYVEPLT